MTLLETIRGNAQLARLELIWAGVSSSRWGLPILIGLYALRHGGPTAVGLAVLVQLVPATAAAPWLSVLAERGSKRAAVIVSVAIRVGMVAAMVAVVAAGAPLALLLVLACVYMAVDTVHRPAQAALFGIYARNPAELAAANALLSALENAGVLAGSLAVGAIVAVLGLTAGFAASIAPLAGAALLAVTLQADRPAPSAEAPNVWAELREGVRTATGPGDLRLLLGLYGLTMLAEGVVDVLAVVAAVGLLSLGPQGAGWLNAAWGVGGVAGGIALGSRFGHGRLVAGLELGLLLSGLPLLAAGLWPTAAVGVIALAVVGVGFGAVEGALPTLTQRLVATDTLARVYGMHETLGIGAMAVGGIAAAGLVSAFGTRGALIASGALLPFVLVLTRRRLRTLAPDVTAPEGVFERLRSVDTFAGLPMATVESIAVRARPERVAAGTAIVREGEPADIFYVIDGGTVEVSRQGRRLRVQQTGSYFGEIGLIRSVPRTATVRASTPVELIAVEGEEFLAAIGEHPASRRAADETVQARLDADVAMAEAPSG